MGWVADRTVRRARPIRVSRRTAGWSGDQRRSTFRPDSGRMPNLCDGNRNRRFPEPRPAANAIDAGAYGTTQHKEELIAMSPTETETTVQDLASAIAAATIGIHDLSPASAVVSFLAPNKPFDFDVIESFCNFVLNFASHESAERWAAERDGIVLLPAAEAFEVGLRAWSKFHTPASTEGQATA